MNHQLQGYYILFGIIIDGLKGSAIPQFSQHMELDFHVKKKQKGAKNIRRQLGQETGYILISTKLKRDVVENNWPDKCFQFFYMTKSIYHRLQAVY